MGEQGGCIAARWAEWEKGVKTYSVQMNVDLTASIDSGLFASELCDFTQNADCAVGELL